MTQPTEYAGRRFLDVMHEAVQYSKAVYDLIEQAKPATAKRIVEFGAGDGAFARLFKNKGTAVDCVEIDNSLRTVLGNHGLCVFRDIREIESESCDFIYTINVLEHIPDLEREVVELRRTLRKDGTLFVFVPAFRMLWTSLDDETKHITRFTRNTLLSALRGGGFEVTRMEYFDTLGFPACLAVRFMEALNVFRYEANSVRFYDRCVFPISHKLDGVFRHLLGKNLIAFARRA